MLGYLGLGFGESPQPVDSGAAYPLVSPLEDRHSRPPRGSAKVNLAAERSVLLAVRGLRLAQAAEACALAQLPNLRLGDGGVARRARDSVEGVDGVPDRDRAFMTIEYSRCNIEWQVQLGELSAAEESQR